MKNFSSRSRAKVHVSNGRPPSGHGALATCRTWLAAALTLSAVAGGALSPAAAQSQQITPQLEWVGQNNVAPVNSVPQVCRVKVGASFMPGGLINGQCSTTGPDSKPLFSAAYELLNGKEAHQWKSSNVGNPIPSGAFAAGKTGNDNIYVCRGLSNGGYHVGRLDTTGCIVVRDGATETLKSFEVLAILEATTIPAGGKTTARRARNEGGGGCGDILPKIVLSTTKLWPANGNYTTVTASVAAPAKLESGQTLTITKVEQDECTASIAAVGPDQQSDISVDAIVKKDSSSAELRAERDNDAKADGRVYMVTVQVTGCPAVKLSVEVPKTAGATAIDSIAKNTSYTVKSYQDSTEKALPAGSPCASAPCVVIPVRLDGQVLVEKAGGYAIWPADHGMVPFKLTGATGIQVYELTQDECVLGLWSTDQAPDGKISPDQGDVFSLTAERADGGNGRVYHVSYRTSDPRCPATGEVLIAVPMVKDGRWIDDAPATSYRARDPKAPATCSSQGPPPTPTRPPPPPPPPPPSSRKPNTPPPPPPPPSSRQAIPPVKPAPPAATPAVKPPAATPTPAVKPAPTVAPQATPVAPTPTPKPAKTKR